MSGLQQTYQAPVQSARADFKRSEFELLIKEKGRRVIVSKSLKCPCKDKASNQQSNCKNCGGTGWIFVNPRETRMVLQTMNITPDYKAWSEEITGDLKVTASDLEELTFMDRLEVLDAKAIFNEVLFVRTKGNVRFAFTAYDIKEIKYIGYFEGVNLPIRKLVEGVDFSFDKNIIQIINSGIIDVQGSVSLSIRYVHAPVYYMVDMKRESMESFELISNERLIHLPVHGIARRGHYILTAPNLAGDRLLDNNYNEPLPIELPCQ